jgi:hypothetical protein
MVGVALVSNRCRVVSDFHIRTTDHYRFTLTFLRRGHRSLFSVART